MNLKLDLHDIYSEGKQLEKALVDILSQAESKKAKMVEQNKIAKFYLAHKKYINNLSLSFSR